MKKKVMNIKPQEVTENGERSVRYKGSDGKFHNIAAGSQGSQQGSTPTDAQTEQSVVVGNVTIENDKPTITVDELIADRFYKIDSDNGGCLVATSMEMVETAETVPARGVREELTIRVIGNSKMGFDSKVVETVTLDEQEHWVLTLSGWAVNPVMTLLSDRDTLKQLTLNHQELFEDFLNYTQLGSATYDNHGNYFGSFTQTEDGWIICDKDVVGRNATLTLAINLGMGAFEKYVYKTFRLTNYAATIGTSFEFKESNGKLVMVNKTGDIIWGFSVFKLTGVLGTLVSYADETHALRVEQNSTYYWNSPNNGDKLLLESAHPSVHINKWINEEYYIDETVNFTNGEESVMLEFLSFPDPSKSCGYAPYMIVNGVPRGLSVYYQNSHGGF